MEIRQRISNNQPEEDSQTRQQIRKRKRKWKKYGWRFYGLVIIALLLCCFLVIAFFLLVYRLGLSKGNYPKNPIYENSYPSLLPESALEVVGEFPSPPCGVAISSRRRIFATFHPNSINEFIKKKRNGVVLLGELLENNTVKAFPSMSYQHRLSSPLALRIDKFDRLWVLDSVASIGTGFAVGIQGENPKLIGLKLSTNVDDKNRMNGAGMRAYPERRNQNNEVDGAIFEEYLFPSNVAGPGSFLKDFQVDPSGDFLYILDSSVIGNRPALIVFSIKERLSYRLLDSHQSLLGDSYYLRLPFKFNLRFGPLGFKWGATGIAVDTSGSNIFFGAGTSQKLHALSTSHILSYGMAAPRGGRILQKLITKMQQAIRVVSEAKPVSDSFAMDSLDRLWISAIEHSALALAIPQRAKLSVTGSNADDDTTFRIIKVIQSKKLLQWPAALTFGPGGLYISNSFLHFPPLKMLSNIDKKEVRVTFHIFLVFPP